MAENSVVKEGDVTSVVENASNTVDASGTIASEEIGYGSEHQVVSEKDSGEGYTGAEIKAEDVEKDSTLKIGEQYSADPISESVGGEVPRDDNLGAKVAEEDLAPRKRPLEADPSAPTSESKRAATEPITSDMAVRDASYAIQDAAGGNRQSVLVPKDAVGFVIGKGGETIKDLMHRSGAHIEVDRSEGATTAPMRAFFVTGTAAQIENARSLIHEKVAGVLHSKAEAAAAAENLMGATNIEIWVPMDRVGMIIGSGGQVIKQLQEKSGATIVVHNDRVSQSGEKLVTIVGGPSESEVARNLVHEIMTKPKPQGSQQQQASTQQQQQAYNYSMYGNTPSSGYGSYPMYSATPTQQTVTGPGTTTKTVYVPNSCVGIVIGKGGDTIRDLQQRSGAHVKVTPDKEAPKGATERAITISGGDDAVRLAHNLLNDIVNEALARLSAAGKLYTQPATSQSVSNQWSPSYPSSSVTETLHVPNDKVGLVIGKGGQTIRELQQRSGARIVVAKETDTNSERNTRPVTVTGPQNFVDQAKNFIHEKISGFYQPQQTFNTFAQQPYSYAQPAQTTYPSYDQNMAVAATYPFDPSGYTAAVVQQGDQQAIQAQAQAQMYYQQLYAYGYPQASAGPAISTDGRTAPQQRQPHPTVFPGSSQPGPPRH